MIKGKKHPGSKSHVPAWIVTVPKDATDEEVDNVLDTVLTTFPPTIVGSCLVVREGVHFQGLDKDIPVGQPIDPDKKE